MSTNDTNSIERGRVWADYLDSAVLEIQPFSAPANGLRLVAMGDSWFNYFPPFDVLVALQRKYGYAVSSVAVAGSYLTNMAPPLAWDPANPPPVPPSGRGEQLYRFIKLVAGLPDAQKKVTKAVLISGGGNDVAADSNVLASLLNPAGLNLPPLNDKAVTTVVDVDLRRVLTEVLSATTELCKKHFGRVVPILIHGYAHPVPDGRGAGLGACLRPVLSDKGYTNLQDGADIMAQLIDRLNVMQTRVLADNAVAFAHVTHVDIRGTLSSVLAGNAYKASWQNELHPTIPAGFIAVADRMERALQVIPNP